MINKVILISGPSGVGKNYILNELLKKYPEKLINIPTYTTREPREDDKLNKNRIYISKKEFKELIADRELLEYKKFNDHFYGKKRIDFDMAFKKGKIPLLEIDVQGLPSYKEIFGDNLTSIFISYETLRAMHDRISTNRPDATAEDIERRCHIANEEMERCGDYNYNITNIENRPEIATERVIAIVGDKLK